MNILLLNIIIWVWKLTFQFWNFLFNFKKIIWSKNILIIWYLDSELLFWILNLYFNLEIIDWILKVFSTNVIHNKSFL